MKEYGFPSLKEYLALAQEVVAAIRQGGRELCAQNPEFAKAMRYLEIKLQNRTAQGFEFNSFLKSNIDDAVHPVQVGGSVRFSGGKLKFHSYWINIYGSKEKKAENKVQFRVHFDVAIPEEDKNKKKHPLYHVQLGGRLRETQYVNKDMNSWSVPRIPYVPISLDFNVKRKLLKSLKHRG